MCWYVDFELLSINITHNRIVLFHRNFQVDKNIKEVDSTLEKLEDEIYDRVLNETKNVTNKTTDKRFVDCIILVLFNLILLYNIYQYF